jgi:hypothetical protein
MKLKTATLIVIIGLCVSISTNIYGLLLMGPIGFWTSRLIRFFSFISLSSTMLVFFYVLYSKQKESLECAMQEDADKIMEAKPKNNNDVVGETIVKSCGLAKASFLFSILCVFSAGLSLYRLTTDSAWVFTPILLVPLFKFADLISFVLPPVSVVLGILALIYIARRNNKTGNKKLAISGIVISSVLYPIYWFKVIDLALQNMF